MTDITTLARLVTESCEDNDDPEQTYENIVTMLAGTIGWISDSYFAADDDGLGLAEDVLDQCARWGEN